MIGDPDVARSTRLPVPTPDGFAEAWLRRYRAGRAEGTREAFAIVADDGEFLGVALAPKVDGETATGELGYIVRAAARGRGVATEALRQLTRWAIDEAGLVRIELVISIENEASKRVARRCGYEREGVLRSVHLKEGVREDVELWSLVAAESRPKGG
jgi:RimJ/RimL family protein N-acetyltransferase